VRLLPQLTLLPLAEVAEIVAVHQQDPSQHWAQRRLAFHLVELVHGKEAAVLVDAFSRSIFGFESFDYSTPELRVVLGPQRLKSFVFDRPSVPILELLTSVFPETSKSTTRPDLSPNSFYGL
jgi:tyrosyl-tRNA synthetase